MEAEPMTYQDVPTETLVDTILRSHRALAITHEAELHDVQQRLREMMIALWYCKKYRTEIKGAITEVRAVTEAQKKLINAWNGRHQDFLESFDKQTINLIKSVMESHNKMLDEKVASMNADVLKKVKPILDQLAASLQMEVDALGKKVGDSSHNAMHDLDAFNSAVRRSTKSWQDISVKLYGRVLAFSILGAFTGTVGGLFAFRFF